MIDMEHVKLVTGLIVHEYKQARKKHAPMRGVHEGYAVILEEMDELWDAIKRDDFNHARIEAMQTPAMLIAFLVEIKEVQNDDPRV